MLSDLNRLQFTTTKITTKHKDVYSCPWRKTCHFDYQEKLKMLIILIFFSLIFT